MFPEVEQLLVAFLTDGTGERALTDLPDNLEQLMPLHRVTCGDGDDDGFRLDASVVDIDTFAATRTEASAAAGRVRDLLLNDAHTAPHDLGVVTGVRTVTKPRWLPDPNPNLRRYTATYLVYAHA